MMLGAGWLPADQGPPDLVAGVLVPTWSVEENAPFPTRRSEYRWVANQFEGVPPSRILSAGAGFNPAIHVLEYILANLGHTVVAVDANAASLQMPPRLGVERALGNIAYLDVPAASFDHWVCVSVVEHMSATDAADTFREAFRVLRPGGFALLTTDHTAPGVVTAQMAEAGFTTGPVAPFAGTLLEPPVSYTVVQKPT